MIEKIECNVLLDLKFVKFTRENVYKQYKQFMYL